MYVQSYICTSILEYVCVHMYVHPYICISIFEYICIHTYMYTRILVYIRGLAVQAEEKMVVNP
jgi:hypothetical protein